MPDGRSGPGDPSPVLTAVVCALAGVRTGQRVVVLGPGGRLRQVLEAGAGVPDAPDGPADVVVALAGPDVPGAVGLLRPGGRLVGLAADQGAATRTAARHGLVLRHSEQVEGRVVWSATSAAPT
ncbi:MAG: hypothetical protein ACXVGH_02875 [Mycobacteriales bacterium]